MTTPDYAPPGPLDSGGLRVTALGGIGEIGRNMTVFEHLGRLLIVDCGVLFPTHDEPAVDLILPDIRHIEGRLADVEALVLTHAHEDHIGAIPYLLKMRADIPIVGSRFTLALVAAKCREHRIKPNMQIVSEGERSTHGVFECEYFAVNHSIPDALAIAIHTGAGTVLHTGDIKLDQLPPDGRPIVLGVDARFDDVYGKGIDELLAQFRAWSAQRYPRRARPPWRISMRPMVSSDCIASRIAGRPTPKRSISPSLTMASIAASE